MKKIVNKNILSLINTMRIFLLEYAKSVAVLLILAGFSSCEKQSFSDEDDNVTPVFETYELKNVRLGKILNYPNSTSSEHTGGIEYKYDEIGNVIRISYYSYNSIIPLWMYKENEYSENKIVKESTFSNRENGNPTLNSYIEYLYKGDLLIRKEQKDGSNNILYSAKNYEYDEKGNLIRSYDWALGTGVLNEVKFSYDDQNRLILEESTILDGNGDKYTKHIYDDYDRKIKEECYNNKWNLLNSKVFVYKGTSKTLDRELYYDNKGKQTRKYKHFYDRWGNLIETVIDDKCSMFKRKYDGGLLIEQINYWWHEYGYHGQGQMPENGMSRFEYENVE